MHDLYVCPDCGGLTDRWNIHFHAQSHDDEESARETPREAVPAGNGYVVGAARTEATIDYYAGDGE
jgi:hypothetical protein